MKEYEVFGNTNLKTTGGLELTPKHTLRIVEFKDDFYTITSSFDNHQSKHKISKEDKQRKIGLIGRTYETKFEFMKREHALKEEKRYMVIIKPNGKNTNLKHCFFRDNIKWSIEDTFSWVSSYYNESTNTHVLSFLYRGEDVSKSIKQIMEYGTVYSFFEIRYHDFELEYKKYIRMALKNKRKKEILKTTKNLNAIKTLEKNISRRTTELYRIGLIEKRI